MNTNFGIMQGRLLPKFKNQYQAHPINNWEKEFDIAEQLNLKSIEFIFDYHLYSFNPLMSDIKYLKDFLRSKNVKVKSICADFYMNAPIQEASKRELSFYGDILDKLISNLSSIGGNNIVIPLVDNSSLKSKNDQLKVKQFLDEFIDTCKRNRVSIAIESDLKPKEFMKFLDLFDGDHISVNYDSGNSASLGYSFSEEINLYGDRISNIHIKDRLINGGPVFLGEGNADLKTLKDYINKSKYQGLVIFQAYRDENGLEIFKQQFDYFKNL